MHGAIAQCQQFSLDLALFILELFVALCRTRLPFQLVELLFNLFQQVIEAVQVFTRALDAVFRLAAAFLVLGYAGGLLQERTQIIRFGLDEPGDGALFYNGVTARPQAGAEKDVGNITPAATRVIKEVTGGPVTRDLAADGNFIKTGILARDGAIGVIKYQFDTGMAHRLARG